MPSVWHASAILCVVGLQEAECKLDDAAKDFVKEIYDRNWPIPKKDKCDDEMVICEKSGAKEYIVKLVRLCWAFNLIVPFVLRSPLFLWHRTLLAEV